MSAYANDSRVLDQSGDGRSFKVDRTERGFDKPGIVWLRGDGMWVGSPEHGTYKEYATVEDAIHPMIGDPQ